MSRAWLAVLLLAAAPTVAEGQIFLASRPHPEFTIGPLFVRANVTPELKAVTVDVLWSLVIPPTKSAVEQDLYLLWPGPVAGALAGAAPDAGLSAYIKDRGFVAIAEGRLPLFAESLYRVGDDVPPQPIAGGAPFVTFIQEGGPLGLTSPATYVRIPWTPMLANRTFLMDLRIEQPNLLRRRQATWIEDAFWGPSYALSLTFNDVRPRALFPLYFEKRDRIIRLADDPSQLIVNLRDSEHLKIHEVFPSSARRRLSETLDTTEEVSLFVDPSEGLSPQVLTVRFGYFRGWRAWMPVLIPIVFFALGNLAGPLITSLVRRFGARLAGRVRLGPGAARETGVILSRETLARITPGSTTSQEVLRICGPQSEEREELSAPERRTLVYRGRRVAPQAGRSLGWLATVSRWSAEQHEVEITLERDVVVDVQARVRRSFLVQPEAS